jgi:hypothetical protein
MADLLIRRAVESWRDGGNFSTGMLGRDSDWPLKVTVASALDEEDSISVTYPIEWEGCRSKVEWFPEKFNEAAMRDGLQLLPVSTREGVGWLTVLRKENNAFRVILCEKGAGEIVVSAPEDPGIQPLILYGPNAEIKLRCTGPETDEAWLRILYAGRMMMTEMLRTKDWATIGATGDGATSGIIPEHH